MAYQNPGVYVSTTNNPVISTVGATPINVCFVGDALTAQSQTDQFTFSTGTTINSLSQQYVNQSSGTPALTVTDVFSGATYSVGSDYQIGVDATGTNVTIAPGTTTLTNSGATSGNYTLSFYLNGSSTALGTTSTITYNATAATVATTINSALSTLSSLNLSVSTTGNITSGLTITFAQTSTTDPQNIITTTINSSGTSGGSIVANNSLISKWVNVSYTYSPPYGNVLQLFTSQQAVQSIYGAPFNSTNGAINSPLSLAAQLAFQNGATQIYLMAVKKAGTTPTTTEWQTAINTLSTTNVGNIDTIVPLVDYSTDNSYYTFYKTFINTQASIGRLQRLFLSRGQSSVAPAAAAINDASLFRNQRISVFAPNQYTVTTTNTATTQQLVIDGFYGAAAVAGLYAGLPGPEEPLTHKIVNGFYNIPSTINFSSSDYQNMQSNGVLVLKQNSSGQIYIRHGLNTNNANWLVQEISILAAQDQLYNQIKNVLANANLIGSAYTANTPLVIQSVIQGVLTGAINTNLIQAYTGLTYSQNSNQPTAINVSFSYSPTFPLNYIDVTFGINPTSGTLQYSTSTSAINTTTGA
jgi:hypothetical protein